MEPIAAHITANIKPEEKKKIVKTKLTENSYEEFFGGNKQAEKIVKTLHTENFKSGTFWFDEKNCARHSESKTWREPTSKKILQNTAAFWEFII